MSCRIHGVSWYSGVCDTHRKCVGSQARMAAMMPRLMRHLRQWPDPRKAVSAE
jgi:hypothetical protein